MWMNIKNGHKQAQHSIVHSRGKVSKSFCKKRKLEKCINIIKLKVKQNMYVRKITKKSVGVGKRCNGPDSQGTQSCFLAGMCVHVSMIVLCSSCSSKPSGTHNRAWVFHGSHRPGGLLEISATQSWDQASLIRGTLGSGRESWHPAKASRPQVFRRPGPAQPDPVHSWGISPASTTPYAKVTLIFWVCRIFVV